MSSVFPPHQALVAGVILAVAALLPSYAGTIASTELPTWHLRNPFPTGQNLWSIAAGPDAMVAVGGGGVILRSVHGAEWETESSPASSDLETVDYVDGMFVASGYYDLLTSPDGIMWQQVARPVASSGAPDLITAARYVGGRWVILGSEGVYYSKPDGGYEVWRMQNSGVADQFLAASGTRVVTISQSSQTAHTATAAGSWVSSDLSAVGVINSICYFNGLFAVSGTRAIAVSTDGEHWSLRPLPVSDGTFATLSHTRTSWLFSAGNQFGTSPDLQSWAALSTDANTPLRAVTQGSDGAWVGVGFAGAITTSLDGKNWIRRDGGGTPGLTAITRFNGRWIAAGREATILSSIDGFVWVKQTIPHAYDFTTLKTVGDRLFVKDLTSVFSTIDGLSWSPEAAWPADAAFDFSAVPLPYYTTSDPVWTGDRWLVPMQAGLTGAGAIFSSIDGRNWQRVMTSALPITAIVLSPQGIVAAGFGTNIFMSADGATWNSVTVFPYDRAVTCLLYGGGWFVAATGGNHAVYVSSDGRNWQPFPNLSADVFGGDYIDDAFWLTGEGGTVVEIDTRPPAPIANLSVRAYLYSDSLPVIAGFTLEGEEANTQGPMLVRAVGGSLRSHGVNDVVLQPTMRLFDGASLATVAGDWEMSPNRTTIAAVSQRLGAFPLMTGSADAALLEPAAPGQYTAVVQGNCPVGGGNVLVEVYDARDPTAAPHAPRLRNTSARGACDVNRPLIGGFIVTGDRPRRVLVRAIGPGLAQFKVNDAAIDPRLTLFNHSRVIGENDDWQQSGTDPLATADAAALAGAFPLERNSGDAAFVITVPPGEYTAHVDPAKNSAGGEVLFEVYYLE